MNHEQHLKRIQELSKFLDRPEVVQLKFNPEDANFPDFSKGVPVNPSKVVAGCLAATSVLALFGNLEVGIWLALMSVGTFIKGQAEGMYWQEEDLGRSGFAFHQLFRGMRWFPAVMDYFEGLTWSSLGKGRSSTLYEGGPDVKTLWDSSWFGIDVEAGYVLQGKGRVPNNQAILSINLPTPDFAANAVYSVKYLDNTPVSIMANRMGCTVEDSYVVVSDPESGVKEEVRFWSQNPWDFELHLEKAILAKLIEVGKKSSANFVIILHQSKISLMFSELSFETGIDAAELVHELFFQKDSILYLLMQRERNLLFKSALVPGVLSQYLQDVKFRYGREDAPIYYLEQFDAFNSLLSNRTIQVEDQFSGTFGGRLVEGFEVVGSPRRFVLLYMKQISVRNSVVATTDRNFLKGEPTLSGWENDTFESNFVVSAQSEIEARMCLTISMQRKMVETYGHLKVPMTIIFTGAMVIIELQHASDLFEFNGTLMESQRRVERQVEDILMLIDGLMVL